MDKPLVLKKPVSLNKIVEDIKSKLKKLAETNNFMWFYDLHQVEIAKSAEELMVFYPEAERDVIILSCWLHDIVHYTAKTPAEIRQVKEKHHLDGAIMAESILKEYKLDREIINKVKRCIERHRNRKGYEPKTIEEKIIAAADAYSHFRSIFYLTYFKCHPDDTLDEFVKNDLEKLERDWRDVHIIPEAARLAESAYKNLRQMLNKYHK